MIVSFRDGWLRDFFVEDAKSRKIPADLEHRLFRKIQMIDEIRICGCHPAIISKSCAAIWMDSTPFALISNGG